MRIGLQTLGYVQPAVWIIELGELPENQSLAEVLKGIREVLQTDGSSLHHASCEELGATDARVSDQAAMDIFHRLVQGCVPRCGGGRAAAPDLDSEPRGLDISCRCFLKISHPYDWSGAGCSYVGGCRERGHPCGPAGGAAEA